MRPARDAPALVRVRVRARVRVSARVRVRTRVRVRASICTELEHVHCLAGPVVTIIVLQLHLVMSEAQCYPKCVPRARMGTAVSCRPRVPAEDLLV